jgi:PAS domain S-box-containing protein
VKKISLKANIFMEQSLKTRVTLFTLFIFTVSIWALSYYASAMLREDMERQLVLQQLSITARTADDVNKALSDRLEILGKVTGKITPAILGDNAALQKLLEDRLILRGPFGGGVLVLSLDGTVKAELPLGSGRIGLNYRDRDYIARALDEGKTMIGRPIIGKKPLVPLFGMSAPIFDSQGKTIGALVGITNLDKSNFLDKITENRYGNSGYFHIIDAKNRVIISSTDKSRIMSALPARGIAPLIDRHIQGHDETGVMVNSAGVEVLASAKHIDITDWFVVAALPTAEAFAPIYAMQKRILVATIFLILLAGGLIWWMLRRQLTPMLAAANAISTMSYGDECLRPLPIIRDDEIGKLIGGFNGLLETLAQREEALKRSEAKQIELNRDFVSFLENTTDFIYFKDENSRLRFCSQTLADITGHSSWRDMIGKHDLEIFPKDTAQIYHEEEAPIFSEGKPLLGKTDPYYDASGVKGWVSTNKWPLFGDDGKVIGLFGISRDVTELKVAQQKLQTFNEELKKQVEAGVRSQMRVEAERQKEREALIQSSKMAELGNMLGAIIHQWKQPLNSMAIDVQEIRYIYKDGELNAEAIEQFIASIMGTIGFMSKTADDFRDFYKPSKEKKIFSILNQVKLVTKLMEKQLKISAIALTVEGDESICTLGFESEFKQVVLNIINNAKEVFEERKNDSATLTIRVSAEGEKALLTISDNAGGIPSELLPDKLFEPFASTKGEKGTGIGLSLSKTIIEENMQGKISVKNIGDGACFMIELPIS